MPDFESFWSNYALLMAESVFVGVLAAHAVMGICKLCWQGIVHLWDSCFKRN